MFTRRSNFTITVLCSAVALPLTCVPARAQVPGCYFNLHTFDGNFSGSTRGSNPRGRIAFDAAGNMYGTSTANIWELGADGSFKVLHVFGQGNVTRTDGSLGPDGGASVGGVTIDSNGTLYGTTDSGGKNLGPNPQYNGDLGGAGIVWKLTSDGQYTVLHDFGGTVTNADQTQGPDGFRSACAVTFDAEGNMFGTCYEGGPRATYVNGIGTTGGGVLWEIKSNGQYVDLHDFGNGLQPDGSYPYAGVTIDASGNKFGVAAGGDSRLGGPVSGGMVWELTADGQYRNLHDFGGTVILSSGAFGPDGSDPYGGVAVDEAGNLYGTAEQGGPNPTNQFGYNAGLVWKITPTGKYVDLHDFGGNGFTFYGAPFVDGVAPMGDVTLDAAGNLYGTSSGLWRIFRTGEYSSLLDFSLYPTALGTRPTSNVAMDSAGNLYGTCDQGGLTLEGTIWKATAPSVAGTISSGLHMFSVPYSDGSLDNSGGIMAVWDPVTTRYRVTPDPMANKIRIGQAYWSRFANPVSIGRGGIPAPTNQTFEVWLRPGWNMVGDPFPVSVPINSLRFDGIAFSDASSPPNSWISPVFYRFDSSANKYVEATSIDPYEGYWVYDNQEVDLDFPSPAPLAIP